MHVHVHVGFQIRVHDVSHLVADIFPDDYHSLALYSQVF